MTGKIPTCRVFRDALSPRLPTGNGYFPPLTPDATQLVLWHFDVPRLNMLKLVSKSVANACRRSLCSGDYDLFSCIRESNITLPIRAFLTPYLAEYPGGMPDDVYIIHEFCMEAWYDGRRITDMSELVPLLLKYCFVKSVPNYARARRDRMKVVIPRICIERPGVGFFHTIHDVWHHMNLAKKLDGRQSFEFELLMALHPFAFIGKHTCIFTAAECGWEFGSWPSNLLLLAAMGRIESS